MDKYILSLNHKEASYVFSVMLENESRMEEELTVCKELINKIRIAKKEKEKENENTTEGEPGQ